MDTAPAPALDGPQMPPYAPAAPRAQGQARLLRRAVITLCIAFVAVMWVFVARQLATDRRLHDERAWQNGRNLALAFERDLDAGIKTLDSTIGRLGDAYRRGDDAFAAAIAAIDDRKVRESVRQITVIDANGGLAFSSLGLVNVRRRTTPVQLADSDHFQALAAARDDRLSIGKPKPSAVSGEWSIEVARKLTRADGGFAGVLSLAIDPGYFSRLYAAVDIGPNGAVTLVRDGGVVMARGSSKPPPENPVGKSIDPQHLIAPRPQNTDFWIGPSPIDDALRWVSYRHHDEYPLAVLVALSEEDLFGAYRARVRNAIGMALAVSLGIFLLGYQLLRLGRRLEAAQRYADERDVLHRTAIDTLSEGLIVYDEAGKVVTFNPAALRILRLGDAALRRSSLDEPGWKAIREDRSGCPAVARPSRLALGGQPQRDIVVELQGDDGDHRWLKVNAQPIIDPNDVRITGALVSFEDITEKRAAAAQLAASEARLRGIVDNIRVATWELDLATWQFTYVSPPIEKLFGYAAADWLQPDFWPEHLHPDDRAAAVAFCVGCTQRGEDHDFEYRFLKKDGSVAWVRDIVKVIVDDNQVAVSLTGVMIDVTAEKNTAAALANEHALLRSLIDSVPDLIFFKDRNSVYLGCNRAFSEFVGRPESEQIGKTDFDFLDHERAEFFRLKDHDMLESGESRRSEEWANHHDGRRVLLDTLKAPFLGPRGEPLGLIGISRDTTERQRAAEQALLAQSVFESTTEGIVVTDGRSRILSVNPAFTAITGWSAAEAIGGSPTLLKSGHHPPEFYADLWRALRECGHWAGEIWNRRKSGEVYVEWMTINAIRDANGESVKYVALFSDITLRKHQEEEIWRQANFDALTGLANRNLFHDRLERALARARRNQQHVGLMFIDLDRFKWINDTLGHEAGDRLLVEAAARLRACVRDEDTVARLGGDEFTIVLQALTDHEPLQAVADKVLETLAQPFQLDATLQYISGSVGITIFPNDGDSSSILLRNADIAMYQAKESGKNRYQFYSPDMQADALARVRIEQELRQAVADGGFVLHYQPIVVAGSREMFGAEALLRWRHPTRGLVAPADFLPVAEDTGLMLPIGEWVIDEACRQWRQWADAGQAPLHLAINVSAMNCRDAGLRDCLAAAMARHKVPGDVLTLEVTEALMIGRDASADRLRELKSLGVHYSLDDFGTGYSSLSTLKRFPFDAVKIDRSFVANCPHDADDSHLIEAIVFMAHSLNLHVVAEGVENAAQFAFLRDLGCDYVQGYLFSRPLAGGDFARLLGNRNPLPGAIAQMPTES